MKERMLLMSTACYHGDIEVWKEGTPKEEYITLYVSFDKPHPISSVYDFASMLGVDLNHPVEFNDDDRLRYPLGLPIPVRDV